MSCNLSVRMKGLEMTRLTLVVPGVFLWLVSHSSAYAQSSSSFDDFEGNLSQWVFPNTAIIVEDPLRPGNHVLTFTGFPDAQLT